MACWWLHLCTRTNFIEVLLGDGGGDVNSCWRCSSETKLISTTAQTSGDNHRLWRQKYYVPPNQFVAASRTDCIIVASRPMTSSAGEGVLLLTLPPSHLVLYVKRPSRWHRYPRAVSATRHSTIFQSFVILFLSCKLPSGSARFYLPVGS